jgi:hypothetical protein
MVEGIKLDGTLGPIDVFDLDETSFRLFMLEQLARAYPVFAGELVGGRGPSLYYRQRNPDIIRERRPDQRFGRPGANHDQETQESPDGDPAGHA